MLLDRMPSISLGIIVPAGASSDTSHHWPNELGALPASVRFDAGGYSSARIQGEPAALRGLAAALLEAAHLADQDTDGPVAEGVAG